MSEVKQIISDEIPVRGNRAEADQIAQRILDRLARAGLKVLSREPTETMLHAVYLVHGNDLPLYVARSTYRAMFDASPPSPGV